MDRRQSVVPAYAFIDRGVRRFAFQCPFCGNLDRHGDTGAIQEWRGNDNCDPNCRLYGGISFLVVGEIASLDAYRSCRQVEQPASSKH